MCECKYLMWLQILDENEIDRITRLPLTQLLAELRQRHLLANDVLTSFQFKVTMLHGSHMRR